MSHLISDVRVVGLGKVGELLAMLLIDSGFAVTGYDFRERGGLPFRTRMLDVRDSAALAAALLGGDAVLIADEPANGLDPEGIAWLRRFLRDMADDGRTVLVSSHLLAEVARTADRIVVISEGRLRFDGGLSDLAGPAGPGDADALETAFLNLTVGAAA